VEGRPAHLPVEVLGLQVEREHVRQDGVHGSGDIPTRLCSQVGGRDPAHTVNVAKHARRSTLCERWREQPTGRPPRMPKRW
jgi:hypothetical protein